MAITQCSPSKLVSIQYKQLVDDDPCVLAAIKEAYDINGLGVLTVSGVPGLPELRRNVLTQSVKFAGLPKATQDKYADPAGGSAGAGWSCGVEFLEDGQPDTHKGSYFANPLYDVVTEDEALRKQYPSYLTPNIWPEKELPDYKTAFREAGQLIIEVGLLLTRQCDKYVKSQNPSFESGKLERVLRQSKVSKGRLLHYFPSKSDSTDQQAWCTQHTDHGSLTGLLSAMYFKDSKEVPNPDASAGLYIRDRSGLAIKAGIPADHIAYQMGESMQVHSGGLLRATPHYVQTAQGSEASGVARDTLAIFMQPNYDELMDLPCGADANTVGIGQWKEDITFGEFSELTVRKYYKKE